MPQYSLAALKAMGVESAITEIAEWNGPAKRIYARFETEPSSFFTISFNGETIPVSYDGEPGGIFKECIPVVVHGVSEQGTLLGDRVEVKHSDEYVAVNDERVADAEAAGCSDAPTT